MLERIIKLSFGKKHLLNPKPPILPVASLFLSQAAQKH